jgi:hypothetical protein
MLVVLGDRCEPEFYNHWQTAQGLSILPAKLGERRIAKAGDPTIHPALGTFQHPALRLVAESAETDMGTASVTSFWQLQQDDADDAVRVAGALDTGDPLILERQLGKGRVFATAVSLDDQDSNLPAMQTFLPFVHELVYDLMRLPGSGLEFDKPGIHSVELRAAARIEVAPSETIELDKPGLRGEYFADAAFGRRVLQRLDATISFDWKTAAPAPGVPAKGSSVRWTGTLIPPHTDQYSFTLEGERSALWINGQLVTLAPNPQSEIPKPQSPIPNPKSMPALELVGNRPYAIRVEHIDSAEQNACQLFWQSKSTPKQAVPAEYLSPRAAWQHELERADEQSDTESATLAASLIGPDGIRRPALVQTTDDGVFARLDRADQLGMYQLSLPDSMRDDLREMLVDETVPILVRSSADESRLATLSDDELAAAKTHLRLVSVASTEDLILAISGEAPGYRLWKYLAVAALLLAIGEIALARWIAVQRRRGSLSASDAKSATTETATFRSRGVELFATVGTGQED